MANSPWSVKGVDPETREAAKIAARRAGVPIGVWLSQVIRQAVVYQVKGSSATPGAQAPGSHDPSSGPSPSNTISNLPAPTMHALFENLQRLIARVERIEETGNLPNVSVAPIERAVMRMSERLDRVEQGFDKDNRSARRGLFGRWR